ncbi:MAG TPA: BamA/TamA family outer membrane protein [Lacibacter sp.]|nr:BamA/TamA family outer membrane protein [Lacibacter sp.]
MNVYFFRQVNLPAEWNMNVDACHGSKMNLYFFRQVNLFTKRNMYVNACQNVFLELQMYLFVHQNSLKYIKSIILLLLLNASSVTAQTKYLLHYHLVDTSLEISKLGLLQEFTTKGNCSEYIFQLPKLLQKKGFIAASVDSLMMDAEAATVWLYIGKTFKWSSLTADSIPQDWLNAAGYREKNFTNQVVNMQQVYQMQERLLTKMENTGYPFAKVYLDSFRMAEEGMSAVLKVNKGPLYKIDSIRVYGNVKISNEFLQRYLELPNGAIYQKQKLMNISNRLLQLPYLTEEQRWNLNLLGTGSILNLYLKEKKSSQINGIIGFLPSNDQLGGNKLLVTGDFNLNLKNGFGLGESLSILFQQIQVQSPRLQLGYQQPFLFGSAFGADFSFEGFKKDSSFLNITLQAGVQYSFGGNKSGKIFFQQFLTNLSGVDTLAIRLSKRLPDQIDQTTTNVGVDYEWYNTDYRFNPRKGFDVKLTGSAGIRRIRENNSITSLKNPSDPGFDYGSLYDSLQTKSYTFRLRAHVARYFKTGKQTALKTAIQTGIVKSPNLFRNELFQIGGFKLLRGFDEESIFANAYAVATMEYRLLIGLNSYLYAFTDGGWAQNKSQFYNTSNSFIGAGLGMAIETKAGIFNITFAAGRRSDVPLNLRQSKIHFGYVNFF